MSPPCPLGPVILLLEPKDTPAPNRILEGFDEEELVALIPPDALPAAKVMLPPDKAVKLAPDAKLFVNISILPPDCMVIAELFIPILGATKTSLAVPVLSVIVPTPAGELLDDTTIGARWLNGNKVSDVRLTVPLLENEVNPPPGMMDGEILVEPELLKLDGKTVPWIGAMFQDS